MKLQDILQRIAKIDGWLSSHEGYFLYRKARRIKGTIVEIGSWKGKSTICLAAGVKERGLVYAIDPHEGKYSAKNGIGKKAPTFAVFKENLVKAGLGKVVKPIIKTSEAAAKRWRKPIVFLFIDGLHDYKHTYQDYSLWSPLLAKRGEVALHDAFCGHDGPERVVLEEILPSGKWSGIGVVGSIVYAKKERARTFSQKLNLFRHRILIPLAITLNKSDMNSNLKFFLIHRIIKLLLLNRVTMKLLYEKI